MDRGAWQAIVHGVAKSETRLGSIWDGKQVSSLDQLSGSVCQGCCIEKGCKTEQERGAQWTLILPWLWEGGAPMPYTHHLDLMTFKVLSSIK